MSTAIDYISLNTEEEEPFTNTILRVRNDTDENTVSNHNKSSLPTLETKGDDKSRNVTIRHTSRLIRESNVINEEITQYWSGVVESIDGSDVLVTLKDKTDPEQPDEQVKLDIKEFDKRDLDVLQPGAMFLWYMGYRQTRKTTKYRISVIRLRRLPKWSQREISRAQDKSTEIFDFFHGDTENTTS